MSFSYFWTILSLSLSRETFIQLCVDLNSKYKHRIQLRWQHAEEVRETNANKNKNKFEWWECRIFKWDETETGTRRSFLCIHIWACFGLSRTLDDTQHAKVWNVWNLLTSSSWNFKFFVFKPLSNCIRGELSMNVKLSYMRNVRYMRNKNVIFAFNE